MEKNYTYAQQQVWRSAQTVAQQIFNLTHYFPEEEGTELVEAIRNNAQSLPAQIALDFQEEAHLDVVVPYQRSLDLLNILEGYLINAFDQGCITERELKTSLEATNIYSHCLKMHWNKQEGKHHLIDHLERSEKYVSDKVK